MNTDCRLLLVALAALAKVIAVIDNAVDSSRSDFDFLLCDVNRNLVSGVITLTTQQTLFVLLRWPTILPYSNRMIRDGSPRR